MLHRIGLLLIASTILIPMPIAGGLPFLVASTILLNVLALRLHVRGNLHLPAAVPAVFCCALVLLGWECFTALFHYTMRDLELIAARGVWILIGFAYLTLLTHSPPEKTVRELSFILFGGCAALLVAMVIESTFYPHFEVGRQLGSVNIPWPRATGVPQSDGKIGVYLCLSCAFFVVAYANTRRLVMLLGVLLSIAPLAFTQSRSTLVGLGLTLGFLFLYYVRTTRNVYLRLIAVCFGALVLWQIIAQFDQIYSMLVGEGVFARNVDARGEGNQHAINMIAINPFVGPGAEYLLLEGMHTLEIHSTFFGMAVKSGIISSLLFVGFIIGSASLATQRTAGLLSNTLLVCALVAGPLSEHNLYPGYFNEHLWLIAPIALAVYYLEHGQVRVRAAAPKQARWGRWWQRWLTRRPRTRPLPGRVSEAGSARRRHRRQPGHGRTARSSQSHRSISRGSHRPLQSQC